MQIKHLLFLCLVIAGCQKADAPPVTPKVPVKVGKVIEKTVPYWMDTVGNVVANNTVNVRPQVGGIVTEIHVKEGQIVKEGDLLYVIDPRPFEAQVLSAEGAVEKDKANLAYQKILLERYSKLVAGDYVSKVQIEQIETQIQTAEGQLKQDEGSLDIAKINLEYAYVHSPIDGKISQYNINLGNVVVANDPNALTVIRQLQPIQLQFSFPQRDFEEILKEWDGSMFKFESTLYGDQERKFTGDVFFVDNTINTNTGAILFKGIYPNENLDLWPGAFIRVKMLIRMLENAVLVPLTAVEKGQLGFTVFVLKDDQTVELRTIKIGPQIDDHYLVKEGVSAGETVVTLGQLNLRPGTAVEVKP